jgi:O-antigen ligase
VLALVKERRLLPLMVVGGALLLLLPQTQAYVQRFAEGVQWQDLASQMRLGEYKDAFALIARHPWIGVGFAGTPEISLYLGVSSAYLLMAEEMGLIGLAAFLLVMGLLLVQVVRARRLTAVRDDGSDALLLGLAAALAGILAGGILDHYFFNLDFPHSLTLFWLYVGLTMVAVRLAHVRPAGRDAAPASPA